MGKLSSTAPKGLAASGRKLWDDITGTYQLRPDELRNLEDACREADWVDRLESDLDGADLIVRGSQGQPVANPLLQEVRQHRQLLRGHLGSLKLPDGDAGEGGNAGRALANARWRRSG